MNWRAYLLAAGLCVRIGGAAVLVVRVWMKVGWETALALALITIAIEQIMLHLAANKAHVDSMHAQLYAVGNQVLRLESPDAACSYCKGRIFHRLDCPIQLSASKTE